MKSQFEGQWTYLADVRENREGRQKTNKEIVMEVLGTARDLNQFMTKKSEDYLVKKGPLKKSSSVVNYGLVVPHKVLEKLDMEEMHKELNMDKATFEKARMLEEAQQTAVQKNIKRGVLFDPRETSGIINKAEWPSFNDS